MRMKIVPFPTFPSLAFYHTEKNLMNFDIFDTLQIIEVMTSIDVQVSYLRLIRVISG